MTSSGPRFLLISMVQYLTELGQGKQVLVRQVSPLPVVEMAFWQEQEMVF